MANVNTSHNISLWPELYKSGYFIILQQKYIVTTIHEEISKNCMYNYVRVNFASVYTIKRHIESTLLSSRETVRVAKKKKKQDMLLNHCMHRARNWG